MFGISPDFLHLVGHHSLRGSHFKEGTLSQVPTLLFRDVNHLKVGVILLENAAGYGIRLKDDARQGSSSGK